MTNCFDVTPERLKEMTPDFEELLKIFSKPLPFEERQALRKKVSPDSPVLVDYMKLMS